MAKSPAKDPYRCAECGWSTAKWVGRCGECQTWGSIEEVSAPKKLSLVASAVTSAARPIGEVSLESAKARSSGVSELDRVLGGGLVPGAAILLAGEPGVGKTAVAEGLALKICNQEVATCLSDKEVVVLDVSSLLAGTKYRGEFEERIKRIMYEIKIKKNVILVIDEVHCIGNRDGVNMEYCLRYFSHVQTLILSATMTQNTIDKLKDLKIKNIK